MLKLALTALLSLAAFMPAASAQALAKEAKINRILNLSGSQSMLDEMIRGVTLQNEATLKSIAGPDASPERVAKAQEMMTKVMALVRGQISWEKMRPLFVKLYDETFTDEEITGLLAFYETPAGRSYLTKIPTMTQKMMALAQSQMMQVMPEVRKLAFEATAGN